MKRLFINDMESLTTFGFGLVLVLSLSVVFAVLWQLDTWDKETFSLVKDVSMEAKYTHQMRDAVRKRTISIQRMLNDEDVFDRDAESLKFMAYATEFAEARKVLFQMRSTPEILELNKRISDAVNYAKPFHEKLVELLIHGNAPKNELKAISREGGKAAQKVVLLLDRLVDLQQAHYEKAIADHEESQKKFGIIAASVYAGSLIIAIFVVRLTTHRYKHVSRLSILDGVTGSYNRRYFDMVIEEEWKRSMREYTPISLIMADIDFFKSYNDEYGHQMGDICLFSVAKIMGGQLKRASDFIARYGGEEFVIVLPNTNAENARIMAERLRRSVEEARIKAANEDVSSWVTVSIGVATTTAEFDQLSAAIVKAADQALYKSKHEGRNRVSDINLATVD
jgi:diguanylate cyclase (GGDEF)-like protein